ncbi:39c2d8f5-95a6-455f-aca3-967c67ae44be [Sclerotinia trifoliorum]|uniref:39c2d8f5-95a6-455f-aca3-967c67ae44be n=1 Tax=Sclerotinia trifoliorum TaxID=28548 RepID=A0A8H2VRZ9_9HELO|nr:39c2d8f5-95a6-455f-aca3-967c67ae44be [Sclerotinia trifoliorum]
MFSSEDAAPHHSYFDIKENGSWELGKSFQMITNTVSRTLAVINPIPISDSPAARGYHSVLVDTTLTLGTGKITRWMSNLKLTLDFLICFGVTSIG